MHFITKEGKASVILFCLNPIYMINADSTAHIKVDLKISAVGALTAVLSICKIILIS